MKRYNNLSIAISALCLTATACDPTPDPEASGSVMESSDATEEPTPKSLTENYLPFSPDDADDELHRIATSMIRVSTADGMPMPESVQWEAEQLRLRFANTLANAQDADLLIAARSADKTIRLTYMGKSNILPPSAVAEEFIEDAPDNADPEERYRDGASWMTGFNPTTGSEFELRIPHELRSLIGDDAEARGIPTGSESEEFELKERHIVGTSDTRVMKGALNTRQSSTNLKKIVSLDGCTGALVGPHHILTAGHCLYGGRSDGSVGWISRTVRVGRNGSSWWGSAIGFSATPTPDPNGDNIDVDGDNFYWVSSEWKSRRDSGGFNAAWDIGIIVTPNDDLATSAGWFGWNYSNISEDDMLNRGYPSCGAADSPPEDCEPNHMFGDTNECGTGGFDSNYVDSQGFRLYGYHSCDATPGHSGSPLYRQNTDGEWVVRGVHKGTRRPGSTGNTNDGYATNAFTLITRDRSDLLSFYRSAYP